MNLEQIVFYLFAAIISLSAIRVVTVRHPVRAAMYLVLCFFATAGLWIMLEAEFLAITLILVYVGAVMVLFLFVVMMLDINIAVLREGFARYLPFAVLVALFMAATMIMIVSGDSFGPESMAAPLKHGADYSNTRELGMLLYTVYVYPFELAAVLLVVAIVAAIALTLRHRATTKFQHVHEQVSVQRNDRLRVVSMKPEQRR